MRKQIMVTIGREHGSGGHYIAQLMSEKLGIALYDKEIVTGTIKLSNYSPELVEKMDEKPVNLFVSRRIGEFSNSVEMNVAQKTFEFIKSLSESGESFIVVGRCAEHVLRGNPNVVKLFINGDIEDKIARVMRSDSVDRSRAEGLIKTIDRKRKLYHNFYCDAKWGDSRGYDIVINSSRLGIEATASALAQYVKFFIENDGTDSY